MMVLSLIAALGPVAQVETDGMRAYCLSLAAEYKRTVKEAGWRELVHGELRRPGILTEIVRQSSGRLGTGDSCLCGVTHMTYTAEQEVKTGQV
jgi:hypothetical protein